MWPFKKKKNNTEEILTQEEGEEGSFIDEESGEENKSKAKKVDENLLNSSNSSNENLIKITTELDRLKASVESFAEVRKTLNERISGLSEQIGELRAMILDRDRTIQEIELKAVKAADLVESVQPDKLMIELQKEDAKFEALKANLEGNESMMERVMEELKEVRKKIEFFRGIEEIIKLSEEVRKELIEIKKIEASININTDKVDTIYSELRKELQEVSMFSDSLQELKIKFEQNLKDMDMLKTRITALASKEELDKLVQKVQRYIEALQEINKTSSLTKDINRLKSLLEEIK